MPKTRGMLTFLYTIFILPLLLGLIFLLYKYNVMFLAPISAFICGALVVMLVNETHGFKVSKQIAQIMAILSIVLSVLIGVNDYMI